jgi:hypothetical protein
LLQQQQEKQQQQQQPPHDPYSNWKTAQQYNNRLYRRRRRRWIWPTHYYTHETQPQPTSITPPPLSTTAAEAKSPPTKNIYVESKKMVCKNSSPINPLQPPTMPTSATAFLNAVQFNFSFTPDLHNNPLLKSILYILGGLFIIGCISFSPVILTTLISLIILSGYVYSTVGLFFLIGYHSYMIITYIKEYGSEIAAQWYRKVKNCLN